MNLIQLENTAVSVTFAAAGFAMVVFLIELALRQVRIKPLGMAAMGVAFLGSLVTLVARGLIARHVPWSNLWESMIFMLFGTLLFYFVVEMWYKPRHFGVVSAPLVLILIGGASILPPQFKGAAPLMPALQSYWIKIHTSAILISYAAFTISFAAALAYFFFYWQSREPAGPALALAPSTPVAAAPGVGAVSMAASDALLPSNVAAMPGGASAASTRSGLYVKQLEFFDELTYRLILLGFPLLMFGIITGAMWANGAWGSYWSWDPKETWALITWFIYAAYLHARMARDWTGPKAAGLAALGFVSMVVTYIGVNYLSSGLHSYGFLR